MRTRHQTISCKGSIHFITTVTRARGQWFVDPAFCSALLELFESYRAHFKIECLGYILMPDHFHTLLLQTHDDDRISACLSGFKKISSVKLRPLAYPPIRLWRNRYDDVPVPHRDAVLTKVNYMHDNAVRGGLSSEAELYPWSSAAFYLLDQPGIVTVNKSW
jgi:putative transposase